MQTKKPVARQLQTNDSLPILYVDGIDIRHRRDGLNLVKLTTSIPEGKIEQARLMIDDKRLRKIIDTLCLASDYYPNKASPKEKASSEQ